MRNDRKTKSRAWECTSLGMTVNYSLAHANRSDIPRLLPLDRTSIVRSSSGRLQSTLPPMPSLLPRFISRSRVFRSDTAIARQSHSRSSPAQEGDFLWIATRRKLCNASLNRCGRRTFPARMMAARTSSSVIDRAVCRLTCSAAAQRSNGVFRQVADCEPQHRRAGFPL